MHMHMRAGVDESGRPYDASDDTWEPAAHILPDLLAEFEAARAA